MRRLAWLPLVLAGCLDAHTTRCAGKICPVGRVCSEAHQLCVQPEQMSACGEDSEDGDSCSFPEEPNGVCTDGVCFTFGCGNRVVEGPEVCDDGNIRDGDGCSADCLSTEECGNGVVDSQVGEVCDDGNLVDGDGCQANCALPKCGDGIVDELEACDDNNLDSGDGCNAQCSSDETCGNGIIDVAADEECDDGDTEPGLGCGPTCKIEVCGNGILDPDEACDDGNNVGGDGCGPACQSDETCGNGTADFLAGEQCDDSNFRSGDGCSSQCTAELPVFSQSTGIPPGQKYCEMVYDASHRRLVRFGGVGPLGERDQRTTVLEEQTWSVISTERSPPPRSEHVLVYDAGRRRVVLFGGLQTIDMAGPPAMRDGGMGPPGDGGMRPPPQPRLLNDTWVLMGELWIPLQTGDAPPPLSGAAAAYDAARDEIVLFGGTSQASETASTWIFDGSNWAQRTTAAAPSARSGHLMAYDATRQRVVLFGGSAGATPLRDTWEWDGSDWTQNNSAGTPTASDAMTYDGDTGHVVLFGGDPDSPSSELWEYDGTQWSAMAAGGDPPSPRFGAAFAYDPRLGLVVRNGTDRLMGFIPRETYVFRNGNWRELVGPTEPGVRLRVGGAWDSVRHEVVIYGGVTPPPAFEALEDLWTYNGEWSKRRLTSVRPGDGAFNLPMVENPTTGRVVSVRASGDEMETWELEGDRWFRVLTPTSPPALDSPELVCDRRRNVILLLGGTERFQVWEYEGSTWQELDIADGPSPRRRPNIGYDEHRGVTLLFGGFEGPQRVLDTWELDGTNWTQIDSPMSPRAVNGAMTFNPARGRLTYYQPNEQIGLWEFDGMQWVPVPVPVRPTPRASAVVIADRQRDVVVVTTGDPNGDTWELAYRSDIPQQLCTMMAGDEDGDGLVGCADPDCEEKLCRVGHECREGSCVCAGGDTESQCGNERDDDCDGLADCDDPDCMAAAFCLAEADCTDGIDEDNDGLVDCADPGCDSIGACETFERSCGDAVDNDGDGLADCDDPDCYLVACAQPG